MKFRRGMTVLERRRLREEILVLELREAYRRAGKARLTLRCRYAMSCTGRDPAAAREHHALCRGEEPGSSGCLCQCHDVITGSVESGVMASLEPGPGTTDPDLA